MRVEVSVKYRQIVVSTQREVKILDLMTGRTLKVFSGLVQGSQDDISLFEIEEGERHFYVGDHR